MLGEIKAADVLLHPLLIAKLFGAAALVRCVIAIATRRTCTFLELAVTRR